MLAEIQITGRAWDGAHIKSARTLPAHFRQHGFSIVKEVEANEH